LIELKFYMNQQSQVCFLYHWMSVVCQSIVHCISS